MIMETHSVWMPIVIFVVATIYSAIGQGGGTGYLAVMALGGLSTSQMRPTALALNILVSAMAGWKFKKAGRFSPQIFWPSIVSGAPAAMLGAMIDLPPSVYKVMVAVILFYAAERLYHSTRAGFRQQADMPFIEPQWVHVCIAGALIGLVSGLTGIGGGIFLSPIMVLGRWTDARNAAGTSAIYTLVNSIVGMLVVTTRIHSLPENLWLWLITATAGAWIGSEFGLKGLSERAMRRLLALALASAALRSAWSAFLD